MANLIRGALIEYGSDFLGPIPNAVIFQFNPESLDRTIQIPPRPTAKTSKESSQAGETPTESIRFVAHFSAADMLNRSNVLARGFGIGPQLAALEKMVYPASDLSGLIGAAIDAIGDAIFRAEDDNPRQPMPRESYPRILFIWGLTRVLPVKIDSMSISEKEYDFLLNPVRAEVTLGLSVRSSDALADDDIATGALKYSNLAKDGMAIANLANTVSQIADIIPF